MKNILIIPILFLISISLTAQDEVRELSGYDALKVSGALIVTLHEGNPRAEITMLKGDLENLKTEIKSGTLKIYYDNKGWGRSNGKNKARIDLYYEHLNRISAAAGCVVESNNVLRGDSFDANVSSGARMELEIQMNKVDVDVSSGGSLAILGETGKLDVDVSSGGSFRGAGLEAKNVSADASSGGSAKVWATKSIDADASSGGSVRYKGDPDKKNLDPGKWSGGNISKI